MLGTIPGLLGDLLTVRRLAERSDWFHSAMRPIGFGALVGIAGGAAFWWLAGRHLAAELQSDRRRADT